MKKILYILDENQQPPSGVVSVVNEQLKYFSTQNYKIQILVNKNHWLKKKNIFNHSKIKISKLNFYLPEEIKIKYSYNNFFLKLLFRLFLFVPLLIYSGYFLIKLTTIIRLINPNIILNNNGGWPGGQLNRYSVISSFILRLNSIFAIHNYPIKKNITNYFSILIDNFLLRNCTSEIVTVTNDCKKYISKYLKTDNVSVIYNGTKNQKFKNLKIKKNNKKFNNKIKIGYFGKIEKRKGIELLINSLEQKKINCEVIIYGNIDNVYAKKMIQKSKGLSNKFEFKKTITNIDKILKKIDFVILPSINFESFGMILIEAMSFGVPSICSNLGSMKEVIINNCNGLVFEANNSRDLSKTLLKATKLSENERKKFRKNCFNIFMKKFDSKIMSKKYLKLVNKYEK